MDTMENRIITGLDEEIEAEMNAPVETAEPVNTKQRRPFVVWEIGGNEYRLKLTTSAITRLEKAFGRSLLSAVMDDGIPPVSTMVVFIQAALQKFHHGFKSDNVERLLDEYIEAGGNQIMLLQDLIYPLMHDAGFFTDGQMRMLTMEISEADSQL